MVSPKSVLAMSAWFSVLSCLDTAWVQQIKALAWFLVPCSLLIASASSGHDSSAYSIYYVFVQTSVSRCVFMGHMATCVEVVGPPVNLWRSSFRTLQSVGA